MYHLLLVPAWAVPGALVPSRDVMMGLETMTRTLNPVWCPHFSKT